MKVITVYGQEYIVYPSNRKNKKFMVRVDGEWIHFGAKGYKIAPGTKKGDSYCARSLGIKSKGKINPNILSRAMWKCKGKRSAK